MIPWQNLVSSRAFFEDAGHGLSIGVVQDAAPATWREGDSKRDGYGRFAPARAEVAKLRDAVDSLKAHGVPPLFVCAYAEIWAPAKSLAAYMTTLSGEPYDVGCDAWYFEVQPGASGWSAHRGRSDMQLRVPGGYPDILDTWVPLRDVSVHDACMHVLPLHADAHYPNAMSTVLEGLPPVALPVRAGEALAWDANLVHAGGPSHPELGKLRQSLGFTVSARARAQRGLYRAGPIATWEERIDLLAQQLLLYGPHGGAPPDWTAWAKGHLTLLQLSKRRAK